MPHPRAGLPRQTSPSLSPFSGLAPKRAKATRCFQVLLLTSPPLRILNQGIFLLLALLYGVVAAVGQSSPPVARDDNYTVHRQIFATPGVLGNDTIPPAGVFFNSNSWPQRGSLRLNGDGTLTMSRTPVTLARTLSLTRFAICIGHVPARR